MVNMAGWVRSARRMDLEMADLHEISTLGYGTFGIVREAKTGKNPGNPSTCRVKLGDYGGVRISSWIPIYGWSWLKSHLEMDDL